MVGESGRDDLLAGAVGANPPQETLRPPYHRDLATLESSATTEVVALTDGARGPTTCLLYTSDAADDCSIV